MSVELLDERKARIAGDEWWVKTRNKRFGDEER
jgi:hypothetical protein